MNRALLGIFGQIKSFIILVFSVNYSRAFSVTRTYPRQLHAARCSKMAPKGPRPKTKSTAQSEPASTASAPSEPATETQSGPVTMTEALERLLPHCEGSPFKVAEWLDTKHRRGDVGLPRRGGALAPPPHPAPFAAPPPPHPA